MRKFEKVSYNDTGIIPTRADKGSAGYDFYTTEKLIIPPKTSIKFCTNIKACMEIDEVLVIVVRSSLGMNKKIALSNGTGIIDSSYYNNPENEGNIMASLYNYGDVQQEIEAGDRVMQGIFFKYLTVENDTILNGQRKGGTGSSGN